MSILFAVPTLGRRPELLEESLRSIRDQGVEGLDLVLVAPADAPVDDVARRFSARTVADPGQGISAALNAALRSAAPGTTYFAWLGDDDLLRPSSLRRTTEALDSRPDAVLAYGWCDYIDASGHVIFRSRAGRLARWLLPFGPNLVPQPGCLMRLDAVVEVGGLDEDVRLALDLDLFLRLRRRGRLVSLPHGLAAFRWHDGSSTVADGEASAEESDRVRMRYLPTPVSAAYRYLRWPGRWALRAAKARVERNRAVAAAL